MKTRLNDFANSHRAFFISVFLVFSTLIVYWQVHGFGFTTYDDPYYIYLNRMVTRGLTVEGILWSLTTTFYDFWHPVMWWSHMLDCQLFGLNAGMHHLINVLFHVANTLLLFGLLKQMTGAVWRSGLVAALFALHPLHVESVAWLSERKDVLSTFFILLCLGTYVRYAKESKLQTPQAELFYRLTLGLYILALMTKPMVVTLPLVLLLLDWWPLKRIASFKFRLPTVADLKKRDSTVYRLIFEKIPFFGLSLLFCLTTYFGNAGSHNMAPVENAPWKLRLVNIPVSYARYLWKMIWPVDLMPTYGWPSYWEFWQVGGAVLLLVLISLLVLKLMRTSPYLMFGWLMFLGTLLPVIGIVPAGLHHCLADRYMYIPSVGLFMSLVWAAADLFSRWKWRAVVGGIIATLALLACGFLSWFQVGYWRNDLALWKHAVSVTPDNMLSQYNLGCALQVGGQTNAAVEHYQQALCINSKFAEIHSILGQLLLDSGNITAALTNCVEGYRLNPNDPRTCLAMARVLSAEGKSDEALSKYQEAIRLNPYYADAHYYLGLEWLKQGAFDSAVRSLRQVIQFDPDIADAHFYLAVALASEGLVSDAIPEYRETLRLKPTSTMALNNLAWILATSPVTSLRNGDEAIRLAGQACELTGNKETVYVGTLATAYAEAGKFDKAVETSQKACDLAASLGQTNLLESNRQLLLHFKNHEAYHE